ITPSTVEGSAAPPLPVMISIVSLFVRSNLNNAPYLCVCSWRLAWRLVLAACCRPAAQRWARRFYANADRSRGTRASAAWRDRPENAHRRRSQSDEVGETHGHRAMRPLLRGHGALRRGRTDALGDPFNCFPRRLRTA